MTPTMPDGLSERDVRAIVAELIGVEPENISRVAFEMRFAAALWSRWQRSQPDVEAVKREAAREMLVGVIKDSHNWPCYTGHATLIRQRLEAQLAQDFPAAPPVREPRRVEVTILGGTKLVESEDVPADEVWLVNSRNERVVMRLATDAGGDNA